MNANSGGKHSMSKIYIYYNKEGKQVHIKDFSNVNDMFHWCELNCNRIGGHYYMGGNRIMCNI